MKVIKLRTLRKNKALAAETVVSQIYIENTNTIITISGIISMINSIIFSQIFTSVTAVSKHVVFNHHSNIHHSGEGLALGHMGILPFPRPPAILATFDRGGLVFGKNDEEQHQCSLVSCPNRPNFVNFTPLPNANSLMLGFS